MESTIVEIRETICPKVTPEQKLDALRKIVPIVEIIAETMKKLQQMLRNSEKTLSSIEEKQEKLSDIMHENLEYIRENDTEDCD